MNKPETRKEKADWMEKQMDVDIVATDIINELNSFRCSASFEKRSLHLLAAKEHGKTLNKLFLEERTGELKSIKLKSETSLILNALSYNDTVIIRGLLLNQIDSLRCDLNIYKEATESMSLAEPIQYEIDKNEKIHLKLMELAPMLYKQALSSRNDNEPQRGGSR